MFVIDDEGAGALIIFVRVRRCLTEGEGVRQRLTKLYGTLIWRQNLEGRFVNGRYRTRSLPIYLF